MWVVGAILLLTISSAHALGVRKTGELIIDAPQSRLLSPKGICFDSLRNLFIIANTGADQLLVVDPLGNVQRVFGSAEQIRAPRAVAVSGRGALFVAEEGREEIRILNDYVSASVTFSILDVSPFRRLGPVEIVALYVDRNGTLYAADRANRQVLVFGPDLRPLPVIESRGVPTDIWVAEDELFVADPGFGEIRIYGRDGRQRRTLGWSPDQPQRFVRAAALSVATSRTVWVAEEDGSLRGYEPWGPVVVLSPEITGLSRPEDMVIDSQGKLYVVDSGGSVIVIFQTPGI